MASANKPVKIDTLMAFCCADPGFKNVLKGLSIHRIWQKIVGVNIARRTMPSRLVGKTLYVTVSTSSWMEELKYLKKDLIEKVNAELNEAAVEEIIFRLGKLTEDGHAKSARSDPEDKHQLSPAEMENVERIIQSVRDEELREIIRRAIIRSYGKR